MSKLQIQEMKKLYEVAWSLTEAEIEHIHLGYWDEGPGAEDILEAQGSYLRELWKNIPVSSEHAILDIGCGNGATAIWLVQNFGCRVCGIDIVDSHLEKANWGVEKYGLKDKIELFHIDATQMEFPPASFDYIISVEALYHIDEKEKVLRGAHRSLKKEGRLILAEFALLEKCPWPSKKLAGFVCGSSYMESLDSYRRLLGECGFDVVSHRDVTDKTLLEFFRWSKRERHAHLKDIFRRSGIPSPLFLLIFKLARSCVLKRHWGLHFICAKKS